MSVRVTGQTIFTNTFLMLQAPLDGMGLAYVPYDLVQPYVDPVLLVRELADWWPVLPGYHLYYANRQQISPAFALVIEALRYRSDDRPKRRKT